MPEFDNAPLQGTEDPAPDPNEIQLDPVPPQPSAASNRLLPMWRARTVSATRSRNQAEKNLFD